MPAPTRGVAPGAPSGRLARRGFLLADRLERLGSQQKPNQNPKVNKNNMIFTSFLSAMKVFIYEYFVELNVKRLM